MSLKYSLALPDDSFLDRFASGDLEVDAYFKRRAWFDARRDRAAPPTYVFHLGDAAVGLASVALRNAPHPDDASRARARYLMVYVVGVDRAYQGVPDPDRPDRTLAAAMFDTLGGFASRARGVVGLCLWVRTTNTRARRFYEKVGFWPDPGGPVQRDGGAPHLTMRRLLSDQAPRT